jgi:hypothetical protein
MLFAAVCSTFSCKIKKQSVSVDSVNQRLQFQYIPKLLHDTYLGIPYDQFSKAKFVLQQNDSAQAGFRIEYSETFEDNDIRKVTYYFDRDHKQPLYQYIIEYNSFEKLQQLIQQKLGKPNDGSQWIFDSGEGFLISIWTFEKTLCIAGLIKGTEWDR